MVSLGMDERCPFCDHPLVNDECPDCAAELAAQMHRMEEAPIVPVTFQPWFPPWRSLLKKTTILKVQAQRAFVPERLIISCVGHFSVCLLLEGKGSPDGSWAPAELFNAAAFGKNLHFGTITPNDVLCLHVRWTPGPRPAWRLRLMAWLRALLHRSRWDDRPRFQALLMGRLVKSS